MFILTVCVGYENFLDSTHLDVAFLQLMLGCFPAVEQPYIFTET